MIIVGVLILLVFAVIVVATVARGNDPTQVDLGWFVIDSDVTGVFVAGGLTSLLGLIGLAVLLAGLRRSRRRRADLKQLRERAAANAAAAERVRALEAEQSADSSSASKDSSSASGLRRRSSDESREPADADESFDTAPREQ